MKNPRLITLLTMAAFFIGFGLGGVSIHYATAQGVLGLGTSVKQIGSALVEMQRNVDELQKNMGTLKAAKDQLGSLSPAVGGETQKMDAESLKKAFPGIGQ